jgi:hypothetical protein
VLPRSLALAALVVGVAGDALAQARQGAVDITVDLSSEAAAHVEERYVLAASASPISLRVLTRPCATITNLRIELAGSGLAMTESREGPWISYRTDRDTIARRADPLPLAVQYDVRPGESGAIPLVHLASAITGTGSTRTGPVKVVVRAPDAAHTVDFPHMFRQAPNEWSATFVAVPSFVEVAGPRPAPCNEVVEKRGDNGGLVWRFAVLAGIMAAWVPLYLTWARRSGQGEQA